MARHKQIKSMGARIVWARERQELSKAQLARRLGVKTQTLADWERDRTEPRTNRMVNLSGVLGVSPLWLLTGNESHGPETDPEAALEGLRAQLQQARQLAQGLVQLIDDLESRLGRLAAAGSKKGGPRGA